MSIEDLYSRILPVIGEYPVSKLYLFGSRAEGTNRADSDVDLLAEFSAPVSLMTLSAMRLRLEEVLGLEVDLIHGPLQKSDLIEPGKVITLYAA